MIKKSTLLFPVVITLIFFSIMIHSRRTNGGKKKDIKAKHQEQSMNYAKKTFKDIGYGFSSKNINFINLYFDSQVYLNIISNEKGYYSPNQAEIILLDFMEYFTVDNVRYQRSSKFNTYAFVNGVYTYMKGSGKRDLGITISLKYNNNKWFIDQITIN